MPSVRASNVIHDPADRRRLHGRPRAKFMACAEEEWRKRTGRPMTVEELERVLSRFAH